MKKIITTSLAVIFACVIATFDARAQSFVPIPTYIPCASTDGGVTFVCCSTSVLCPLATICVNEPVDLAAYYSGSYNTAGFTVTAPGGIVSGTTVSFPVAGTYTACIDFGSQSECGIITVNPLPIILVNSPSICTGQSVVLTASGAGGGGTYSWSTGAVGTSITVSPTTTTSYTVTGTDGNGCPGTAVATVTVHAPPTVNFEPNLSICSGTIVPINSFASTPSGATFTWTNSNVAIGLAGSGSGALPSFTATNTTSAPIVATITVTPFLDCPGAPMTFTITVNPLPITVHTPPPVCPGSCVILTASGATLYQWQPGGLSGSSVTVCPTTATTYTVTGTSGTCTGTTTVLVTMAPTPTITATASPSTLTPPSATTSFITTTTTGGSGFTYSWLPATGLSSTVVSNPVATPTVTTTYTVTVTNSAGCTSSTTVTVNVAPQSLCTLAYAYTVNGGNVTTAFGALTGLSGQNIKISGVFTVNTSFNFSGCNIVMEPNSRIDVSSGATLLITGQTHIYACDSVWKGINLLSGSAAQIMNSSIIEEAEAGVTLNTGSTAIIENCIFNRNHTAVKVLATTSATSPLSMKGCVVTCRDLLLSSAVGGNPLAPTVWTNILANVYVGQNLKWPYYAYRSIYGVTAVDVNNLQFGNTASPTNFNGFDTLMAAGIHLTRTNAVIYNNKFRHINSTLNPYGPGTPLIGTGVYAIGTTTAAYSIQVGGGLANQPNDFFNVNTAVDVMRYTTNNVLYNTILNTSSTVATWGGYGKIGIRITPSANNTVNVSNNAITNAATGITVSRSMTTTPQTVSLTINYNSVVANASGFCNTGISLTDPTATVLLNGTVREISFNTITEAGTCINLLNVKNKVTVYYNSCRTRYHATANINGIKLSNCATVDVLNNHTKSTVTGANINSYGIYLLNSAANAVRCNTIEHATRSLVFSGNCLSVGSYTQNTMKSAQAGFVLLVSGTVVGTQGSSVSGADNYWDPATVITHVLNNSTSFDYYRSGTLLGTFITNPSIITGPIVEFAATAPLGCGAVPARFGNPEESTMTSSMSVYPNPNNGQFTINTNSSEPKDVMVYDMNGRVVFTMVQTTETSIAVDISNEAKGLYVVKVSDGTNVQTARVSNQ